MIEVVRADITTLDVDAVVNAANSALSGGGGVDGAIHRAAGPELVAASSAVGPIPAGEAVLTPGFRLPARFVVHAVGPVWWGGNRGEAATLRRAYTRSFETAHAEGTIRSIAFPAISTGVYRFPKPLAAEIAVAVMREWETRFDRVVACLFDEESVRHYTRLLDPEATTMGGTVTEPREQPRNPLHGVTLERMLTELVEDVGWERMGQRVRIRCFTADPSIGSSLKFLRRTPWAREKVEEMYRGLLRERRRRGGG